MRNLGITCAEVGAQQSTQEFQSCEQIIEEKLCALVAKNSMIVLPISCCELNVRGRFVESWKILGRKSLSPENGTGTFPFQN